MNSTFWKMNGILFCCKNIEYNSVQIRNPYSPTLTETFWTNFEPFHTPCSLEKLDFLISTSRTLKSTADNSFAFIMHVIVFCPPLFYSPVLRNLEKSFFKFCFIAALHYHSCQIISSTLCIDSANFCHKLYWPFSPFFWHILSRFNALLLHFICIYFLQKCIHSPAGLLSLLPTNLCLQLTIESQWSRAASNVMWCCSSRPISAGGATDISSPNLCCSADYLDDGMCSTVDNQHLRLTRTATKLSVVGLYHTYD